MAYHFIEKRKNKIEVEESHYICAVLNAPITSQFLINSSDTRSFKVCPPIHIPEYNPKNAIHKKLSKLSKLAHKKYNSKSEMEIIDKELDEFILKL